MFGVVVHLGQMRHYQGFQPFMGKFVQQLHEELERHGLAPVRTWTDQNGDFSLTLSLAGEATD